MIPLFLLLTGLSAPALACSCRMLIRTLPEDGASIPPEPVLRVFGYSLPFGTNTPRITLQGPGGPVAATITREADDTWAVRPESRLRPGTTLRLVVWTEGRRADVRTEGVSYVVQRGRATPPPAPVISQIQRYDELDGSCGYSSFLATELANPPPGASLLVWAAEPDGAIDLDGPPEDVIPARSRVALGSTACRLGGFPLEEGPYGRGAAHLAVAYEDVWGERSPVTEIEVPPPSP